MNKQTQRLQGLLENATSTQTDAQLEQALAMSRCADALEHVYTMESFLSLNEATKQ